MIKVKGLFAVSLIAILMAGGVAVNSAVAAIASKGYVDQVAATHVQSSEQTPNAILTTDAGGNVQATAQITQSQVDGLTGALNAKADTTDIPTKTSQLNNDSGFITSDDLPGEYELPVATADTLGGVKSGGDITVATSGAVTVSHADKADSATTATTATNATNATNADHADTATSATSATNATNDADGNEITETYATKDELTSGLAGKQATLSAAQLNAVNSGITSAKVTTYDGYNAKITAAQTAADEAADAAATAQSTANAKVSTAQGPAAANKAVITNASGNITTGTISSAMITDGTITNADIATDAAIEASKVSGLSTVATTGSYDDLADKPTIPSAITVDSALSSTSTNPVQNKVINTALAGKLSTTGTAAKATADADGNNIANTYATKAQLTALDSTSDGTGAVVTNVSQKDGKVSVTKGNVQIPVGSATATTYATIWVE